MPLLFKHMDCPACGHRHHFSVLGTQPQRGREYEYVCPEIGTKTSLCSTVPGEVVRSAPQGAVALTPLSDDMVPSQTCLQNVLPEVKDLAVKVGGISRLSDIVETLKETHE